jgi:hypothetical protein
MKKFFGLVRKIRKIKISSPVVRGLITEENRSNPRCIKTNKMEENAPMMKETTKSKE